ncbi:MAG: DUF1508 domain-containing protein [Pirellulales bacterium]|nr:DUF1508 domain-containing protein [Pirellulales bacterium]
MAYYMYVDKQGYWRWNLVSANNKIIADSSEGYFNKADCEHAISLVKGSWNAPVYQR